MIANLASAYVTALESSPRCQNRSPYAFNLHVHLVFVTKCRREAITDAVLLSTVEG